MNKKTVLCVLALIVVCISCARVQQQRRVVPDAKNVWCTSAVGRPVMHPGKGCG